MRLYLKLIWMSLKSQMQYKTSFVMLLLAYALATSIDILGMWVLFERFKVVEGWTLPEVALIYGVIHMGFSAAEIFARGFDKFDLMVKSGDFDRILLRPRGTLFQIAGREVQLMRLGRFFQGFLVLLWATQQLPEAPLLTLFFAWVGTACLFYGLFVLQALLAFWTTETLEFMNITTFGGVDAGQWPMSLYPRPFQWFFTFIIPLACVAYFPVRAFLDKEWFGLFAPIFGVVFLILACQLWKLGVRHYRSTGS